jgi:uncharacterized protein (TIGR03663 family)
MSRWLLPGLALLLGVGLGLRAPRLTFRPLHSDEGVNAMKFRRLYVNNNYKYNPDEFHGPTLPYLTLPAAGLQGGGDFNEFSESTFRSVPVAFGLGLILLLLHLAPDFGRAETLWAAALTAISPAMVFYSRYYIHEMLLVFFTAWSFICFWRYANSGRAALAVAGGIGLGLMYATKETFVFALVAMALSVVTSALWALGRGPAHPQSNFQHEGHEDLDKIVVRALRALRGELTSSETGNSGTLQREFAALGQSRWQWPHLVAALAAAVATAALFFSSFFTNAAGPLDALRTFLPWFQRAGGATEHVHPWTFYFERLIFFHVRGGPIWSEGFIVALAAAGFLGALRGRSRLLRLIAFYTFWLTLIYTVLPYKTPWCLLGFYHGMILLAGAGAAMLWRACRPAWSKPALTVVLAAGVMHLGWQSWRGNFAVDTNGVPYCDSAKSPYVYSQTLPDALRLVSTVEGIARANPRGYGTVVEVMAPESYWPLPWYLRRFEKVGYWDEIPDQPLAPIMIVSANLHAGFDERPGKTHLMAGYFELRPQVFLELYVNTNLWGNYIKTLPPEKD